MRSGRITKRGAPCSPWLSKDERLRIMGIGNLILGINSVTVPYLIHYDRYYYKMCQLFYYKMRQKCRIKCRIKCRQVVWFLLSSENQLLRFGKKRHHQNEFWMRALFSYISSHSYQTKKICQVWASIKNTTLIRE